MMKALLLCLLCAGRQIVALSSSASPYSKIAALSRSLHSCFFLHIQARFALNLQSAYLSVVGVVAKGEGACE